MTAVISDCGRYRYTLSRVWDESKYCLPFCMLNPSTADAEQDDPTIRRCIGFAKREGYGGIHVVNLFAFRATKPRELDTVSDPVGPDNEIYLSRAVYAAASYNIPIVCAWGSRLPLNVSRTGYWMIAQGGARFVCLGKTLAGYPRHPLYVRADQPLESWP